MITPRASYDVRTHSSASVARVFAVLSDISTWPSWGGRAISQASWESQGDPAPGGVGAVRKLGNRLVANRERITEYDPPHYLAYTIVSRQPMRDYRAIVSLDPRPDGTTITWAGAFEPMIPGTGRLLAWLLTRVVGGMATGLARYAESDSAAPTLAADPRPFAD